MKLSYLEVKLFTFYKENYILFFRELNQKHEQTNKLRNEMFTFKKAQEAWKLKQKEMLVLEERKIEEQLKAASDRSSAMYVYFFSFLFF